MKNRRRLVKRSSVNKNSNTSKRASINKSVRKFLTRKVKGSITIRRRKGTGNGDGTDPREWKKPQKDREELE